MAKGIVLGVSLRNGKEANGPKFAQIFVAKQGQPQLGSQGQFAGCETKTYRTTEACATAALADYNKFGGPYAATLEVEDQQFGKETYVSIVDASPLPGLKYKLTAKGVELVGG